MVLADGFRPARHGITVELLGCIEVALLTRKVGKIVERAECFWMAIALGALAYIKAFAMDRFSFHKVSTLFEHKRQIVQRHQ